jgi:acyl phosphate:glycerol-3-phosphate acyltransferase
MNQMGPPIAAVLLCYLVGSISFAVVVSRLMGLSDPRTYGSGNPGATNVLRSGNKSAALLTLLGDALKGFVAVFLVKQLADHFQLANQIVALCTLAVFLGHLYPIFHGFKGGKGVATAAGVLFALNGWLGLATLLTWLIIAIFFRYSSLAAMISATFALFYQFLLFGFQPATLAVACISVLLIWRHRANVKKLLSGTESRLNFGKKS